MATLSPLDLAVQKQSCRGNSTSVVEKKNHYARYFLFQNNLHVLFQNASKSNYISFHETCNFQNAQIPLRDVLNESLGTYNYLQSNKNILMKQLHVSFMSLFETLLSWIHI